MAERLSDACPSATTGSVTRSRPSWTRRPRSSATGATWSAARRRSSRSIGRGSGSIPGPFGCLGVGPPFAIAAKLLRPADRVLLIAGDGAFGLNGMEMETAVRFKLPMTVVIGNDGGWGQIRNPQLSFFGAERQVATSLPFTRFDQMVEALGGKGVQVTEPRQLRPALERAMGSGAVYCINVVLDPGAYRRGGQVSMAIR